MTELISRNLLERYDVTGPRYTSYPTADRFVEAFSERDLIQALHIRSEIGAATPLSVYVHIPFCESVCYYCACNKVVTKQKSRAQRYVHDLGREVSLLRQQLEGGQVISQLHLGGGSPTFLSDTELSDFMAMLKHSFHMTPGGEYSIEVDPRTVNELRLEHLFTLGFNRLSFGVQDFDPLVQQAVHRVQSTQSVFDLVAHARRIGFESVNVDLIYGLPRQTLESFRRSLELVSQLRPDRLAVYAYAHLPSRFKPQRRIMASELPEGSEKLGMLSTAIDYLDKVGYDYIGMDHFALPDDSLSVAKRQGRLHRNFQGYSTQPDCDLLALGVSAIGRMGNTYSQNAKTVEEYSDALDQGRLPIVRGLVLNHDDIVRRALIMAIMCRGYVDFQAFEENYLIDFSAHFSKELAELSELCDQGLVSLNEEGFRVSAQGWFFVGAIAMVFDRHLREDIDRARFSKII